MKEINKIDKILNILAVAGKLHNQELARLVNAAENERYTKNTIDNTHCGVYNKDEGRE